MNPWESISYPLDQTASNQRLGLLHFVLVCMSESLRRFGGIGASGDAPTSGDPHYGVGLAPSAWWS